MTDEEIYSQQLSLSDQQYADAIRSTIKNLSKLVNDAENTGLVVTLALGNIGRPDWVGYLDAARIIRKY